MSHGASVSFVLGTVRRVEQRFEKVGLRGAGPTAEMVERSLGWFIVLDTGTSLGFGRMEPQCDVGEEMIVTFRKGRA